MKLRKQTTKLVLGALGGLAMASLPLSGTTIAFENFEDYTLGPIVGQDGGVGWAGAWMQGATNPSWGDATVIAGPYEFDDATGDFLSEGQALASGGGRIWRALNGAVTEGDVWVSVVMGATDPTANPDGSFKNGSTQFWLASGASDETNGVAKTDIMAGVRFHSGGVLEYIDSGRGDNASIDNATVDPSAGELGSGKEIYVPFVANTTLVDPGDPDADPPVAPTYDRGVLSLSGGPVLFVMHVDLDADTVDYYVFEEGADLTDLEAASYNASITLNEDNGDVISHIALFTVATGTSQYSNIRIGEHLQEVTPNFNCPSTTRQARDGVTVDTTRDAEWDNTTAYPVAFYFADGTNNEPPTDAADFSMTWSGLYDDQYLYLRVEVDDDSVLMSGENRDVVEVFLDGDNSRGYYPAWPDTAYDELNDFQLIFTLDDGASGGAVINGTGRNPTNFETTGESGLNSIMYSFGEVTGGYAGEIAIPLSMLGFSEPPAYGESIGIDFASDDWDEAAAKKSKHFWCDQNNQIWASPYDMGSTFFGPSIEPIAVEDFDGYVTGPSEVEADLVGQGVTADGFEGAWKYSFKPGWTGDSVPWVAAEPGASFLGDLDQSGFVMLGNYDPANHTSSFARVVRDLEESFDAGMAWVSFVLIPGTNNNLQVRLGRYDAEGDAYPDAQTVAGFRLNASGLQYLDPASDPTEGESYVNFDNAYLETAAVCVMAIDIDGGSVTYWVFPGGTDAYPTSMPMYTHSAAAHGNRTLSFDSIQAFTVFSNAALGDIRIGDDVSQVLVASDTAHNRTGGAAYVPSDLTPVIDGIEDPVWEGARAHPVDTSHGAPVDAADLSGNWKALWDADNLYLLGSITDDDILRSGEEIDAFEFWVDANYGRRVGTGWAETNMYAPDVWQLVVHLEDPIRLSTGGNPGANDATIDLANITLAASVPSGSGTSVIELAIPWEVIALEGGNQTVNSRMGFEVQFNDRDTEANPKLAWADGSNNSWQNPSVFGTMYMLPSPIIAYAFDPGGPLEVEAAGGSGSIDVTANLQYGSWNATIDGTASWLTLDDGTEGIGDGTVLYTVAENTAAKSRSVDLLIAGSTYAVNQAGLVADDGNAVFPNLTAGSMDGFWNSAYFGEIWPAAWPWNWSADHGWQYFYPGGDFEGTWFYDNDLQVWLWMKSVFGAPENYPYLFLLTDPVGGTGVWAYYFVGTTEPREFYIWFAGEDEGLYTDADLAPAP